MINTHICDIIFIGDYMIRLILKEDIEILNKKYNLDLSYLKSLLNNMTEYMYISINNEIDGYMICLDDGNSINIKEMIGNKDDLLKHLLSQLIRFQAFPLQLPY